jgi:hypothetical protein
MPASYTIDARRRLVISTGSGVLTTADLVQHQDRLIADPAFNPEFHQLADFSEITDLRFSEETIRFLAVRHVFSENSRRAIVSPTAKISEAAKKYQTYRELFMGKEQVRIFSDREEAMRWLLGEDTGAA